MSKSFVEEQAWDISEEEWNLLDEDSSKFVFDQGEKYLKELCEVAKSTSNKCYTLMGLLFAICPLVTSMVLSFKQICFYIIASLFAMFSIVICIMLYNVMKPFLGYSIGRKPKELININYLKRYHLGKEKFNESLSYVKYELTNLQHKIDETEKINTLQCKRFSRILRLVFINFLFLIVSIISLLILFR